MSEELRGGWVRAFLVVALAVGGAVSAAVVDQESGLPRWFDLRSELQLAQSRIERLAEENAALQAEFDALGADPFALERAIREDLELARPGEVIVRFDRGEGAAEARP